MTDDRGPEPPSQPTTPLAGDFPPVPGSEAQEPAPPPAETPSSGLPAAAATTPAQSAPEWLKPQPAARPQVTERERALLIAIGGLFLITLLLALMVFAPSIAPIKLGVTRDAAAAQIDDEIEGVARRFARNFLSIDYRTLEADFDQIKEDTTGNLLRQLSQVTNVIREPYRNTRSVSTGRPERIIVVSRTKDVASVQMIVSVTIRNKQRPTPQTMDQPLQLTLVRTGSGWKVSDVFQWPVGSQPTPTPRPTR